MAIALVSLKNVAMAPISKFLVIFFLLPFTTLVEVPTIISVDSISVFLG
jgi:hypothetical protein